MRLLSFLVQIVGALLLLAIFPLFYLLAAFGCGMAATGCHTDATTLFFQAILSREGIVFWLAFLLACGLILGGHLLRKRRRNPV